MVKSEFESTTKELLAETEEMIEQFITEEIEPLRVNDNPEKLLGQPYEVWKDNPQIMALLQQIYGTAPDSKLAKFINGKQYEEIQELEKQLGEQHG